VTLVGRPPIDTEVQRQALALVAGAVAAVLVGAAAGTVGPIVLVVLAAAGLFALAATRPVSAAYVYLAAMPFITGIERGALVPLMRPNEALQLLLIVGVVSGAYVRSLTRREAVVSVTRLDRTIVVLAVLASVWPVAWLLLRGESPTMEDLLSTVTLWRLAALYALFRYVVRTPEQLRRCVGILLVAASALAAITVLEALGAPSIGGLVDGAGGAVGGDGRGQGTLSSSIAVGDFLAYSLAVVLALSLRARVGRWTAAVAAIVICCGILATGQFSAWIAALVVVVVVARSERQLGRLVVRALPVAAVGLAVSWPIVQERLSAFDGELGLPSSWLGRVDNLTNFYLPQLGGFQWVLGVRPDAVLPAPETWREVIYLESGLLWLLWVGGIPLLLAFVWFLRTALRHTRQVATARLDDVGALALGARASLWAMALLTIIDMHLTLRGGGDLLFILLGLSAVRWQASRDEEVASRW
jgi:hypothetical protein